MFDKEIAFVIVQKMVHTKDWRRHIDDPQPGILRVDAIVDGRRWLRLLHADAECDAGCCVLLTADEREEGSVRWSSSSSQQSKKLLRQY